MAWDSEDHWIRGASACNRARSGRLADGRGDLLIALRFSARDRLQMLPYSHLKGRRLDVERQIKRCTAAQHCLQSLYVMTECGGVATTRREWELAPQSGLQFSIALAEVDSAHPAFGAGHQHA